MALGTVIFVPGLMGSQLSYPPPTLFHPLLWLNPLRLATGGFKDLILPVPDDDPPGGSSVSLQPGYPLGAVYALLTGYLSLRGWRVREIVQDWRKSIALDGVSLAAAIKVYGASEPVKILCYSRGGLVTRYALGLLAATGETGLVSRVVGMGVPHTGSLLAVAALSCYHPLKRRIADVGSYLPRAVATAIGTDATNRAVRSFPSVYELLPDPARSWLPPAEAAALYDAANWAGANLPPSAALLAAAKATWAALPTSPQSVDWIDCAGFGFATPHDLPPAGHLTDPWALKDSPDGDGVVTRESARQPGRRTLDTPTAHDAMPVDGRLWPFLHLALDEGLSVDVTVPGGPFSLT